MLRRGHIDDTVQPSCNMTRNLLDCPIDVAIERCSSGGEIRLVTAVDVVPNSIYALNIICLVVGNPNDGTGRWRDQNRCTPYTGKN